jgi:hypothetical protein
MKPRTVMITVLLVTAAMPHTLSAIEPDLPAAETTAVNRQIATLKASGDRRMAQGWSNTKKVAELLCRPAALPVLKKQTAAVDRVFLGTDDPKTLTLENNSRLAGSGEFRTPKGWTDFTFTCDLDPQTGKVIAFQPVIADVPHWGCLRLNSKYRLNEFLSKDTRPLC